ncbi:unnamed protein product [Rhizophagus irregularis]|nr:unnamed protein product [Rhizophagus irregularis]
MDNIDTAITENEEEISTWVNKSKKQYMNTFFDPFQDVFDNFLTEVVKCKKIEEYIDLEKTLIQCTSVSKPGKIPIRLNKPETKVPAVYYFLSLFLIKYAGVYVDNIVTALLRRVMATAVHINANAIQVNRRIATQYSDLQKKGEDLEKIVADSALTNGLVIQDLENRIRNLEAQVIAKERIILEKSEANNILWEKIKALEVKEEKLMSQVTKMEIDKEKQTKKKRPNKKRKRARAQHTQNGMIGEIKMGPIDDSRKDDLGKYYAEQSRDVTFYDIPAYWSDEEIFNSLNTTIKDIFRWQVCKRLEDDNQQDDCSIIRYFAKTYSATFGKIIRVNGTRYIILYFSSEDYLMKAVTDSLKTYKVGLELLIKKENDFIDDTGEIKEFKKTLKWRNTTTSRSRGLRMEREQHEGTLQNFASSSRRQ